MIEDYDSEAALGFYNQALELYLSTGKEIFSIDTFKSATSLLVRSEKYAFTHFRATLLFSEAISFFFTSWRFLRALTLTSILVFCFV